MQQSIGSSADGTRCHRVAHSSWYVYTCVQCSNLFELNSGRGLGISTLRNKVDQLRQEIISRGGRVAGFKVDINVVLFVWLVFF
jgi:hypothetical protein